ncbi:MAG: tRNA (adenosine(37)-N6)-dimethylallyltransferase MiaA [Bacillota bacterium]|nr:tRNA (adenosine(37)-N6)-dimethylallyltransferase MiaA [Bacillota bacterium]
MTGERKLQQGKLHLLTVVGPTAVGKTDISIQLAQKLKGEIVSADSVQVYRYLDIGSAKPSLEERKGIPHHLIDVVEPNVNFTVYDYQSLAKKYIDEIYGRGNLPILTGGTGLYIKALLDEYNFSSRKVDPLIRKRLEEECEDKGKEYLYGILKQVDPISSKRIHHNDIRRIMRALEFYYLTGEPISLQWELTKKKSSNYNTIMVGITMKRNNLYDRINNRVDQMVEDGLVREVEGLLERGYKSNLKSMQSLGYNHVIKYLEEKYDWKTTMNEFKRDTRRYAKRQLTWFRADERVTWYERSEQSNINPILDSICYKIEGY